MRRRDIQLLSAARQGDVAARCEVGRRYLTGSDGFPRHIRIGIEYLSHPSVKGLPEVAKTIAEGLPLEELIDLDQREALEAAASLGSMSAQLKLGVWRIVRKPDSGEGMVLLKAAAEQGSKEALDALAVFKKTLNGRGLAEVLSAASGGADMDGAQVAMLAAQQAIHERDLPALGRCLGASMHLAPAPTETMADLLLTAVQVAEQLGEDLKVLSPASVQACLEMRCGHGNYSAAYTLGRALCGISCGSVRSSSLVQGTNLRKGAALLLRAADGGCDDAWLHLYRIHSNRAAVPNPQMARFFLEKAAAKGNVEAQRRLGASILRESDSIRESEEGMNWLFKASRSGDKSAQELLNSFVLPLQGSDAEAKLAIEEVSHQAPWLAFRMRLSRDFGLTKLEALTVNPAEGKRSWGLVIGQNPFTTQRRVSAPRAIPALTDDWLARLQEASDFFGQVRRDGSTVEGDLRHRARTQRNAFGRHKLNEKMFFADVTSTKLDVLRKGPKWAVRFRRLLATALSKE